MSIKLGAEVEDMVSGLVGIVVSRTEHLNGCIQYAVTPRMKKGAIEMASWNVDEKQLKDLSKPIKVKKDRTGGPTRKIIHAGLV